MAKEYACRAWIPAFNGRYDIARERLAESRKHGRSIHQELYELICRTPELERQFGDAHKEVILGTVEMPDLMDELTPLYIAYRAACEKERIPSSPVITESYKALCDMDMHEQSLLTKNEHQPHA